MRNDRDAAKLTFPPPPNISLPAGCGCVLMRNDRDATKLTFPPPLPPSFSLPAGCGCVLMCNDRDATKLSFLPSPQFQLTCWLWMCAYAQ